MHIVHVLAAVNPLLIVVLVAVVYGAALFFRYNLSFVMLLAWTCLCLSIVLLPGGKTTLQLAGPLPVTGKLDCLGASVAARAPWDPKASARKLGDCYFQGAGVNSAFTTGSATGTIANHDTSSALASLYGG